MPEPLNVTYLTYNDVEEMVTLNPDAIVFVIDTVNEVPYIMRLGNLVQNLSSVEFDIDGGSFI